MSKSFQESTLRFSKPKGGRTQFGLHFGKLFLRDHKFSSQAVCTYKHLQLQQILENFYKQSHRITHVAKWTWKGCGTMWSEGKREVTWLKAVTISAEQYRQLLRTEIDDSIHKCIISTPTNTNTTCISIASMKTNALFSRTNTPVKHSCFPQQSE